MALKLVNDVDGNGFNDELFAIEIAYLAKNFKKFHAYLAKNFKNFHAYLAKNFKNFHRNNNRRARGKNHAKPRNFRRNDPTKVNSTKKPKEKVGQTYNNSMGQQCFGC